MSLVLPPVQQVDNRLFVPEWEKRERARLDAARCPDPKCGALPPNHLTGCGRQKLPDPAATRCRCGYVTGTLGCQMTHGGAA